MEITIVVPDDIAARLAARNGADVSRAVLEALALEGYRSGELTHAEVGRLLGIGYRFDVDAFLKAHGVSMDYTLEDLERDRATARQLGLR